MEKRDAPMIHAVVKTLSGDLFEIEYDGSDQDRLLVLHSLSPDTFPLILPYPEDYVCFTRLNEEEKDKDHFVPYDLALIYPSDTGVRISKMCANSITFTIDRDRCHFILTSEIPTSQEWYSRESNEIKVHLWTDCEENNLPLATVYVESFKINWNYSYHVEPDVEIANSKPYSCMVLNEDTKKEILRLYQLHC